MHDSYKINLEPSLQTVQILRLESDHTLYKFYYRDNFHGDKH